MRTRFFAAALLAAVIPVGCASVRPSGSAVTYYAVPCDTPGAIRAAPVEAPEASANAGFDAGGAQPSSCIVAASNLAGGYSYYRSGSSAYLGRPSHAWLDLFGHTDWRYGGYAGSLHSPVHGFGGHFSGSHVGGGGHGFSGGHHH